MQKRTLSVLVENTAGVLSQVTRLFSRKRYNIESLAVGTVEDPRISRITIITTGDDKMIQQLTSQLRKLQPVISMQLLEDSTSVSRELSLIKVRADTKEKRDEIMQIVNIFRVFVIDIAKECMTIAVVGDGSKTEALLKLLEEFEIMEMARTGVISLERGTKTIYNEGKENEEFTIGKGLSKNLVYDTITESGADRSVE